MKQGDSVCNVRLYKALKFNRTQVISQIEIGISYRLKSIDHIDPPPKRFVLHGHHKAK